MDKARKRIENGFERLSLWTFQWRWAVLLLGLVLTGLAVNQLPHLKLDTSNESFFHKDDPTLLQYEQFLDEFDRDEIIVVGIQTDDVFKEDFLTRLSALHDKLESTLPYLDEIISLKNVVSVYGKGDELIVEDLLETWPSSEADMQQLEKTVLNHPVYPNLLISKDKTFTTLIIRPQVYNSQTGAIDLQAGFEESNESENKAEKLTPEQIHVLISDIRKTLTGFEGPDFNTYVAGVIVVTDDIMQALNSDIPQFTTYAIILISVFLFILYRRISGIILPLTIVLLSLMATLGLMAASNTSFTVFTQILPSFLLAVGIGNSIHLLTIFYRRFNEIDDKQAAMQYAMGHSGLAMLMTSITTAGGLLSFSTAEMAPIGDLGIFGAVGVMLALLYTIVFLPALIAVMPIKSKASHNENTTNAILDGTLIRFADIAVYH
ncbi:MAG: MMPL family transporter, partial [Gammaproteobacteria bacterium]|nr:MMPL family transporter [Gammaproteobacteria bacterium]